MLQAEYALGYRRRQATPEARSRRRRDSWSWCGSECWQTDKRLHQGHLAGDGRAGKAPPRPFLLRRTGFLGSDQSERDPESNGCRRIDRGQSQCHPGRGRTPFGKLGGGLASKQAIELGSIAIRAAMERSGVVAERC